MTSLLNTERPPVFCPGCSHDRVVHALDVCLQELGISANRVCIVTDIGCSGLFDTFFNTHALHGLHGRALTYATGLKLACPSLTVITIMGDGGLGIGGAHVLSSCRRNLDINLLVLNNFNYGMTGGQCSATTPVEARTTSGFLAHLESPLDICSVGSAAGSGWVERISATEKNLVDRIKAAISHEGFSLMDITGVCPGRFARHNKQSMKLIARQTADFPLAEGLVSANQRPEYGTQYRYMSSRMQSAKPAVCVSPRLAPTISEPYSILLLGAAGQRINSAAEVLCLSAMSAGLHVSQKSDYPITVLRGHSISEVIFSPDPIRYTAIEKPDLIIALASEGVMRRTSVFQKLDETSLVLALKGLPLPDTTAKLVEMDLKKLRIHANQFALGSLAILTQQNQILTHDMLLEGVNHRFSSTQHKQATELIQLLVTAD